MKIICAGFWKTGTKSLANALELLGHKVYDYDYQLFEKAELWDKFVDGTVTDDEIREALKDVDVLIDGPVIAYWEEIARAIPDAKIILTKRDEDGWWDSFKRMMDETPLQNKIGFIFAMFCPSGRSFIRTSLRFNTMCLGVEGPFRLVILGIDNNPRMYKNLYRKHNSHVLHTVPKEKLLVFDPRDGWEPLCKFLDQDIPDVAFPHKNKDGAHFKTEGGPKHPKVKRLMAEAFFLFATLVAFLSIIVYSLFSCIFS